MRGSRNVRRGGGGGGCPGQSDKNCADNVFILVLSLLYRSQMVSFKVMYHFSRFHFPRVQLFPGGGVQLLIPYRNPYNLWFSRGVTTPAPPPPPPLDPHLCTLFCDVIKAIAAFGCELNG